MKTKAELLIESLTINSGRTVFSIDETIDLVEISKLEAIGDNEKLTRKIIEFKSGYVKNNWLV